MRGAAPTRQGGRFATTKKVIAAGTISFAFASASIGAPKVVHAAGDDVDAAVFVAPSGPELPWRAILSPDCAAGGGSQTAVICTGGHGYYTFNSAGIGGLCEGVSTDDIVPATCRIDDNNGAYTNIICGTGTLSDTSYGATITEADGATDFISYGISLFAGVGVLTGSSTDGGTTAGVVLIVPTSGNCINTDVTAFEVFGAAAVTG